MSNPEGANEKVANETLGGLIWIKRRNGTWWPGQILDIKDVPENSFASKKGPGTPVKLLGKEDAVIEWYNIETSKRIKTFRCSESVEWLKGGNIYRVNSDKSPIYAKRTDAIAQALQIEAEHTNTCLDMPKSTAEEDESKKLPGAKEDGTERSPGDKKVDQLSYSGASFESADSMELTRRASGQVSPKGVERTRLLQDFGPGLPSKRKRKLTQRATDYLETERHCQALKIAMVSSAMDRMLVTGQPHGCPTGSSVPEVSESNESAYIDSTKDNEAPPNSPGKAIKSSSMAVIVGDPCNLPVSTEDLADVPAREIIGAPAHIEHFPYAGAMHRGACKGNNGGLSSKYISSAPEIAPVGAAAESSHDSQVRKLCFGYDKVTESGPDSLGATTTVIGCRDREEGKLEWNLKRRRNSKIAIRSEWCWASFATKGSDAVPVTYQRLVAYHPSDSTMIEEYHPLDVHLGGLYDPHKNLYDVDLIINARSSPQNFPYISLFSNLTHKSIVGHALNVKALDDGFCDNHISGSSCYIDSSDEDWDESAERKRKADSSGRKTGKRGPYKPRKKVKFCETLTYYESGILQSQIRRNSSMLAASQEKYVEEDQNQLVTKPKVSTLGCVPLKTVFGRINTGLNS